MHDQLLKLLELTTTSSRDEAIEAMLEANALIRAGGKTWRAILAGSLYTGYRQDEQYQAAQQDLPSSKYADIPGMFTVVMRSNGSAFITSLYEQYQKKHWLSAKQEEALRKFYARCT